MGTPTYVSNGLAVHSATGAAVPVVRFTASSYDRPDQDRAAANDHPIMADSGSNRLGSYDSAAGLGLRPVSPKANLMPNDGWHYIAAVGNYLWDTCGAGIFVDPRSQEV